MKQGRVERLCCSFLNATDDGPDAKLRSTLPSFCGRCQPPDRLRDGRPFAVAQRRQRAPGPASQPRVHRVRCVAAAAQKAQEEGRPHRQVQPLSGGVTPAMPAPFANTQPLLSCPSQVRRACKVKRVCLDSSPATLRHDAHLVCAEHGISLVSCPLGKHVARERSRD